MSKYDPARFGPNLRRIMEDLEISQTQLSEAAGLTRAAVSQVLSGKREPSLKTVCRILEYIPVSFERMVGKQEGKNKG